MEATWIWYPGDFEVWLGNRFNNRRTERGAMFPPFWKQDSHWPTVVFATTVRLDEPEEIDIFCEGQFNVSIDGKLQSPPCSVCCDSVATSPAAAPTTPPPSPFRLSLPAGEHRLTVKVWNQVSPPTLFIDSSSVKTGPGWLTTYEDKIWIDEQGQAHDSGLYVPAAFWPSSPASPPSAFRLPTRPADPSGCEDVAPSVPPSSSCSLCCHNVAAAPSSSRLFDFGRETFGFLRFHGLRGEGTLHVYYGESREEALDRDHCETLDACPVSRANCAFPQAPQDSEPAAVPFAAKAFRYVFVETSGTVAYDRLSMDEEYALFDPSKSGSFRCSDDELNRIWEVSARTLDLTTREFFCDGIKRDRWVWSGDAIQSYLMNYYLRFDTECVKRTIRQLLGKDPVTCHVNTIMDYTFYWFISIWQYLRYTGDLDFLREMWPRMKSLMDYVLSRTNANGFIEGRDGDWVFVDWADFPMSKRGALCFEQLLFRQALATMTLASMLMKDETAKRGYARLCSDLSAKIDNTFWDEERGALLHALTDGQTDRQVTKFPNIFAILFPTLGPSTIQRIAEGVLLNPDVPPITTPYMRFYELEALCQTGHHEHVLREMKAYWGGMLREGATTFWEKYNPEENGTEHLAMYGRPYGKSLCHAWGASPIYLLGKYFLGVQPTMSGYEEYEVSPVLCDLEWMEGDVPTPSGLIHVRMDRDSVTVHSNGGKGKLNAFGKTADIPANKTVRLQK